MGHCDGMSLERCDALGGAVAPFPAAPSSKWRPFNNSVIFQPICFKIEYEVDRRMRNYEATPPQRFGTVRGAAAPFPAAPFPAAPPTNGAGSITLSFFSRFASNSGIWQIGGWGMI